MSESTKGQLSSETYGQFLGRTLCDNSAKRGLKTNITPKCFNGERKYRCVIHDLRYVFILKTHPTIISAMTLCTDCMKALKKDCTRRGWTLRTTRLTPKTRPER